MFGKQNYSGGGYQWFDPSPSTDLRTPAPSDRAESATVRGPGLNTLDFSALKTFPIKERVKLEFRSEFINLTNTPILNSPSAGLGAGLGADHRALKEPETSSSV